MSSLCKSNANWPPGGGGADFATVESNQILTTQHAYNDSEWSVLIDDNGNVLTREAV